MVYFTRLGDNKMRFVILSTSLCAPLLYYVLTHTLFLSLSFTLPSFTTTCISLPVIITLTLLYTSFTLSYLPLPTLFSFPIHYEETDPSFFLSFSRVYYLRIDLPRVSLRCYYHYTILLLILRSNNITHATLLLLHTRAHTHIDTHKFLSLQKNYQ